MVAALAMKSTVLTWEKASSLGNTKKKASVTLPSTLTGSEYHSILLQNNDNNDDPCQPFGLCHLSLSSVDCIHRRHLVDTLV